MPRGNKECVQCSEGNFKHNEHGDISNIISQGARIEIQRHTAEFF